MAPERASGKPAAGARVPISGTLYQNDTSFRRPPSTIGACRASKGSASIERLPEAEPRPGVRPSLWRRTPTRLERR